MELDIKDPLEEEIESQQFDGAAELEELELGEVEELLRFDDLETTAKGTGLAESAGKEDPVELDSSLTL
ncbi:hypothetical protein Tco_0050865 [Tanacetum coccineum]